jgi:hypothetical protein
MLPYGTKVRVRKRSKDYADDLLTGRRLWWVEDMDYLDGTEQKVDHPCFDSPWVELQGLGQWSFAVEWLEVLPSDGRSASSGGGQVVPKNNDGRSECFWCHVPTAKRGGGLYDVCPKCGR